MEKKILSLLNSTHVGRDENRKLQKKVALCKHVSQNLEVFLIAVNNIIDQFPCGMSHLKLPRSDNRLEVIVVICVLISYFRTGLSGPVVKSADS